MESMGTPGFHGYPWILHGYPRNPWVPLESMGSPGINGCPWIPWVPLASMGAHGFRGYPWNPWAPKDSVGTQWNSCDRWIPKSQIPNLTSQSQFPCVVKTDSDEKSGSEFPPSEKQDIRKTNIHTYWGIIHGDVYTPTKNFPLGSTYSTMGNY